MNNGFIFLHRSLLESEVFASQNTLKIWVWCLLKANFKSKYVSLKVGKGERAVKVERGQFIFGRLKAEKELAIKGSTIYKNIQKLERMGNISIKSNSQYSLITIDNYDTYQNRSNHKEQPSNSQVTSKEQVSNKQVTQLIKDNKVNKEKKNINVQNEFERFWNEYDKKISKKKSLILWDKLSESDKEEIFKTLPEYVKSTPVKKYRKNPDVYLRNRAWEDEIIPYIPPQKKENHFFTTNLN